MKPTERIHDKLDRIEQRLNNIDVTLAVNTESLKEHIKRTNLLEAAMEPIKAHVNRVDGALRFLGIVSLIVAIVTGLIKLFS